MNLPVEQLSLTVFFGTLGGALLNTCIQDNLQKRERELVAYESHLARERVVVESVYGLVGTTMVAAEAIIALASYNRNEYRGGRRTIREEQDLSVRRAYTESQNRWRGEQVMSWPCRWTTTNPFDARMSTAWDDVAFAVNGFSNCAEGWLAKVGDGVDTDRACLCERRVVRSNLKQLTTVLEEARVYPWEMAAGQPRT